VFIIGALTAALLNNDAAILLLTPLIVPMIARLYPKRQYLVTPFAFAVFMAAGIAPLATSNPMNLVVAERAGISFNQYAARMLPVAVVAAVASFLAIRWAYRKELDDPIPARGVERGSFAELEPAALWVLGMLAATLVAYPILSALDGPVWIVAVVGACLMALVCIRARIASVWDIFQSVAWDVVMFVYFMFVVGSGLRKMGAIESLASLYRLSDPESPLRLVIIGIVSALGSAVLNNHPMAVLNVMSLESIGGDIRSAVLAALVGGDLGPRFLPIGSLAGLLWMDALHREGIEVSVREFARMGALVTVPALAASLAALMLVTRLPW
jgi:arsenical pump membrane protein